ncbi:CocE/NonD family hydrolase [Sphingomonas suaedae]|uniref:CocE/NonD family hydrolase n=1 Tax=Sphingomonas suaedae TaxID=2599297 RepID=A0A518RE20_9SPHN|nr:CocE/NonD family hydrolase [Sphingomonas suaedae]QDX25679.1 CocE/NonD family hydrolase [Sphingomonas suaedae]
MLKRLARDNLNILAAIALAVTMGGSVVARSTPPVTQAVDLTDQVPAGATIGDYVGEDVMIPMRDGMKLHVQVWRPKTIDTPLPILLSRSPYGFGKAQVTNMLTASYKELADDRFIFVLQDIRGRLGSEGTFVNLRPSNPDKRGVDESTDTYDTIDWLVKNLPANNGKAGVIGVSYGGWTAAQATIGPHPALKAVSSQASPNDMFIGDDFLHNGAFRLDYAWSWVSALETDGRTMKRFDFGGEKDAFAWYLKQQDLATLDQQHLGSTMPSWQNFVKHPSYDAYWKAQRTTNNMPATVATPNLIVAGWYDQEDFYGPLSIYKEQEKGDAKGLNYLVVGPWNHGGWRSAGKSYGPFDLGDATGNWFRKEVELPWFRYWLKGQGTLNQPEALIFQTGSNRWQRLDSWPTRRSTTVRNLYLRAGGKLSFEPPRGGEAAADSFVSDPADPVPYRDRASIKPFMAEGSTWSTWLADDQAPFTRRKDVLFWQSDPLTQDVTISGDVAATLFASTTGSDADWVVKLVDIYPTGERVPAELRGRQRMIANDVFRGRFRKSYERPEAIRPNAVLDYRIDLHSASHRFAKGHRIGVQVQSSWFPLIGRNPQTYVPNILRAKATDFRKQTHRIYHRPGQASAIAVAVVQ